jgi:L-lysine 6-transaminase
MLDADRVHDVLRRHQLVDGFPFVIDLDGSHGVWIRDARTGAE